MKYIKQMLEYLVKKNSYPYQYLMQLTYNELIDIYNKEISIDKQWNDIIKHIEKNGKMDLIKYTIDIPLQLLGK